MVLQSGPQTAVGSEICRLPDPHPRPWNPRSDSGPIISLKQKNICRSHVISKSVQLYGKTFSKKRQSKDKLWMKANDYDVFF